MKYSFPDLRVRCSEFLLCTLLSEGSMDILGGGGDSNGGDNDRGCWPRGPCLPCCQGQEQTAAQGMFGYVNIHMWAQTWEQSGHLPHSLCARSPLHSQCGRWRRASTGHLKHLYIPRAEFLSFRGFPITITINREHKSNKTLCYCFIVLKWSRKGQSVINKIRLKMPRQ